MKALKTLLLIGVVLGIVSCRSQKEGKEQKTDSSELIPILFQAEGGDGQTDSKPLFGYVDRTGTIVIKAQFGYASEFSEGLAHVTIGGKHGLIEKGARIIDTTGGKHGYINTAGNFVINPQFDDASDFSEQLALVKSAGKYGYINHSGEYVIQPQFEDGYDFSEGLASVKIGGKWGYIDKSGKYAINPQFSRVASFFEGLAQVEIDGKCGYIDKSGKVAIEPQFGCTLADPEYLLSPFRGKKHAGDFFEGLASVKVEDKWGVIDKTGKYIVNPQFEYVSRFSEGLAPAKTGGKSGFIDTTGKLAIAAKFNNADPFSEGLAAAWISDEHKKERSMCGYIDKTGEYVIKPQFFECFEFTNGLANVQRFYDDPKSQQKLWIDKSGEIILPPSEKTRR